MRHANSRLGDAKAQRGRSDQKVHAEQPIHAGQGRRAGLDGRRVGAERARAAGDRSSEEQVDHRGAGDEMVQGVTMVSAVPVGAGTAGDAFVTQRDDEPGGEYAERHGAGGAQDERPLVWPWGRRSAASAQPVTTCMRSEVRPARVRSGASLLRGATFTSNRPAEYAAAATRMVITIARSTSGTVLTVLPSSPSSRQPLLPVTP